MRRNASHGFHDGLCACLRTRRARTGSAATGNDSRLPLPLPRSLSSDLRRNSSGLPRGRNWDLLKVDTITRLDDRLSGIV